MSSKNLWSLRFSESEYLPVLRPGSGNLSSGNNLNSLLQYKAFTSEDPLTSPIDVINDFPWTVSPKSSRHDVPAIQMIEYRILYNSLVSNLNYSINAGVESGYAAVGAAVDAAGTAIGALGKTLGIGGAGEGGEATTESGDAVAEQGESQLFSETKNSITGMWDQLQQAGGFRRLPQALKPYEGLYATEATGFNYYFPYLTDTGYSVNNSFGDGEGNVLKPIVDTVAGVAQGLAGIANALKPGTYIEKSKQFSMGQEGRQLTFQIPLLNTMDPADITRNWQLIFGLIYQNRPGRVSKSIIDLPVIYEINLPGVAYMPYAYISNLEVQFKGARRLMRFEVPVSDSDGSNVGLIETIVPDAYNLSVTVAGLNDETRNMLYNSVTQPKLQVGKSIQPGTDPARVNLDLGAPSISNRISGFVNNLLN